VSRSRAVSGGVGRVEEEEPFVWVCCFLFSPFSPRRFCFVCPGKSGLMVKGVRFMADKIMPLDEAVEGYGLFDQMKVQKVVFKV
jgi:hypothetical protein